MLPGVHIGGRGMDEEGRLNVSKMDWSGVNAERLCSTFCFVEHPPSGRLERTPLPAISSSERQRINIALRLVTRQPRHPGVIGSGLQPPEWALVIVKQTWNALERSQVVNWGVARRHVLWSSSS